jgi:hypothetical protein
LEEKKIVLGVAANREKRKGLQDLLTLSETLGEPYRVVLVGLRGKVPPGVRKFPHLVKRDAAALVFSGCRCGLRERRCNLRSVRIKGIDSRLEFHLLNDGF